MRVQHKVFILLAITFAIFSGTILGYQYIKWRQKAILLQANLLTREKVIENMLAIKAESILQPANDYSIWDELIAYVKKPTREWEINNLSSILEAYNLSNIWIFNEKFEQVYTAYNPSVFDKEITLPDSIIQKAFGNNINCHFFITERDTLVEICGYTIVPSVDTKHQAKPQGYFLTAKFWDKEYIGKLETAIDFDIEMINRRGDDAQEINNETIKITKEFYDPFGNHLVNVSFTSPNLVAKELSSTDKVFLVLTILLVLTFLGILLAIRLWVSIPLLHIANCLNNQDEKWLKAEVEKKDEFGKISKLISQFFNQKKLLEEEIASRKAIQKKNLQLIANTHILNRDLQNSQEELKQNLEKLMSLNKELDRQKSEITDSINYASRIQAALLPPKSYISKLIPEYYLFYRPKNIISGDFYWVTYKNNKIVVVVADCTGHGVPGGFMSMLGMAYLTEVVNQSETLISADILESLRKRLISTLHQTGEIGSASDGMDMALCMIDIAEMKIEFSGAYSSLCLVRNAGNDELYCQNPLFIELRGDRMPVGIYHKMDQRFNVKTIPVKKGDMIYLFTDGFQDQIGGKKQEKFKRDRFRELLQYVADKPLDEQKNLLEVTFDGYKGDCRQTDDVLVFGFRI